MNNHYEPEGPEEFDELDEFEAGDIEAQKAAMNGELLGMPEPEWDTAGRPL
ncbi:hypothetical protein [Streptomyces diastaticus]|uniref:hypothetical protein n=1 Tax=Streptomyces diastaticus TaxID=1956 RepID=UPI003D179A97